MRKLLFLLLVALPAAAQTPVTIQNPSFETATTLTPDPSGGYSTGVIPGWTTGNSAGVWKPATISAEDGVQVAYSYGSAITQDIGAAQVGTYALTVYTGNRGSNFVTTYTVSLLQGTTTLCTTSASNSSIATGSWLKLSLSCPVSATGGDIIISLNGASSQAIFDNVSLTFSAVQHQVALAWQDNVNPSGTTYNVLRAVAPCGAPANYTTLSSNLTTLAYTDQTIAQGTTYCYAIQAVVNGVNSGFPLSLTVNVQ